MADLVTWLRDEREVHPVLAAGIAQFEFVDIEFWRGPSSRNDGFLDGNGRTARLLSMLCLFRAGYDFKRLLALSEFYDRDRSAYYRAIQSVREREMDLTGWLEYFAAALAAQLREVQARGERVIRRDILALRHGLSERQRLALGHAMERGGLTIQDCEGLFPGVSRRTPQRELRAMAEKGLLRPEGVTKGRTYRLGDLAS